MPDMPQSVVIGAWRIVRAELPSSDDPAAERFLHFTSDGVHYREHPFSTGDLFPRLLRFRYQMTDHGVFITPDKQEKGWEVPFSVDSDCLRFASGAKCWWLRRIPPSERPEYFTHYYEPPAQTTAAS